jgi:hypothetical protein
VSASSQPESSGSNRNIIIAVVVVVLLLAGYCATRVASMAHTIVGAAGGMAARTDTTHHVPAGSAVYVGDTKVADIVKVIVIHADTTTPTTPARGKADSTLQAALRQQTVIYTASAPGADGLARLNDVIGHIDGTYDGDAPVKITASPGAVSMSALPPIQLVVPGRRQPISVY